VKNKTRTQRTPARPSARALDELVKKERAAGWMKASRGCRPSGGMKEVQTSEREGANISGIRQDGKGRV